MKIFRVKQLPPAMLVDYTSLTDVNLRRVREPAEGLFLAESPKVIERAIRSGLTPRSVLLLESWLPTIEPLLKEHPETPVYVGDSDDLESVTGFHLHRGALASMHRPTPRDPLDLLDTSRTLVVLEGLADHTNVGAIFRSIAALGADGVLLSPDCADPLYRRAVRVSMGAVLQIPWARLPDWPEAGPLIRDSGYDLVAFALQDGAQDLSHYTAKLPQKIALMFGTEGAGLSRRALASATSAVQIPMEHGVDSLNVATAAAIALWAVRSARGEAAS